MGATIVDFPTPHVVVFADPYKICCTCGGWVTGYRNHPHQVEPCGHDDYRDVCPSWSPVDGCCCLEHLGKVDHPVPPADVVNMAPGRVI